MKQRLRAESTLIAPAWHTVVVVLALMAMSVWSAYSHGLPTFGAAGHSITYATAMVCEWLLVALIWYGVRLRGGTLRSLLGDRWIRPRSILRDIGIAILFLFLANTTIGVFSWLFHSAPGPTLRNMSPNGAVETVLWVFLAATAGICEEIIFRGYLQKQSAAMLNSTGLVISQIRG